MTEYKEWIDVIGHIVRKWDGRGEVREELYIALNIGGPPPKGVTQTLHF